MASSNNNGLSVICFILLVTIPDKSVEEEEEEDDFDALEEEAEEAEEAEEVSFDRGVEVIVTREPNIDIND